MTDFDLGSTRVHECRSLSMIEAAAPKDEMEGALAVQSLAAMLCQSRLTLCKLRRNERALPPITRT